MHKLDSTYRIQFFKKPAVFYAGGTVEGRVTLTLVRYLSVERIDIGLHGFCRVRWDVPSYEEKDETATCRRQAYWTHQPLLDVTTVVRRRHSLGPDTYSWRFSFRLNSNVMTSIESKLGYARYYVTLHIKKEDGFPSEYSQPITVIKPFDLNENPIYREPQESEVSVKTQLWKVMKGDACCRISARYAAYAPGQDIKFTLTLQNRSLRRIKGLRVELVKITTCTAHFPKRSEKTIESTLIVQFYPTNSRSGDFLWLGALTIPPTPPTMNGSDLISVNYVLRIYGEMSKNWSEQICTEIKIIIGTIPIKQSLNLSMFSFPPGLSAEDPFEDGVIPYEKLDILPPYYGRLGISEPKYLDGHPAQDTSPINSYRPFYPYYSMTQT